MRRLRCSLLIMLLVCLALPSQGQDLVCDEPGALSRETYVSAVNELERRYSVYLPPCYQSSEEAYPLLLLLHGSNADDSQWSRIGFLEALEAAIHEGSSPPMLVVMPYGSAEANQNIFNGTGYDAILLDFLTHMNGRYRTNGRQAIGGISRGGFWAYHVGFRFNQDFIAIGGHSPFFDPNHVSSAHNPLELADALSADTTLRLWLDRGTADYAADGVEQLHYALQRGRVAHEYVVYPGGGHDETSWSAVVSDYVAFYASAVSEDSPAIALASSVEDNVELWLPAVGFGTLLTSLDSADLQAILAGAYDERLVLTESTVERLKQRGILFHPDTRVLNETQAFYRLWRDKGSYTLLPLDELHLRLRPLWVDDIPVVDQLDGYPLVFESDTPNFAADKLVRITMSGTTALARHTLPAIDAIGVEQAASGISDYVRRADFFHISNEAAVAPGCPVFRDDTLGGFNSMCMKREHLQLFDLLDVDVIELTGNHINDFGTAALAESLAIFERRGITVVGGGRSLEEARSPIILEKNGTRIGWLACNAIGPPYAFATDAEGDDGARPGTAYCRGGWPRESLPVLAAQVDLVLMTVQYREFEAHLPTQQQRIDFQTWAEWGADIVIGTAEHKPMTVEFYPTVRGETAFLHYGLGNLFFDQLYWGNRRFFMDTLYIYDGRLLTVELFPGIIEDRARPRLLTGDDLFNFLHFMFIQKNEF